MDKHKPTISVQELINRYKYGTTGLKRESNENNSSNETEPPESKNARTEKEKEKKEDPTTPSGQFQDTVDQNKQISVEGQKPRRKFKSFTSDDEDTTAENNDSEKRRSADGSALAAEPEEVRGHAEGLSQENVKETSQDSPQVASPENLEPLEYEEDLEDVPKVQRKISTHSEDSTSEPTRRKSSTQSEDVASQPVRRKSRTLSEGSTSAPTQRKSSTHSEGSTSEQTVKRSSTQSEGPTSEPARRKSSVHSVSDGDSLDQTAVPNSYEYKMKETVIRKVSLTESQDTAPKFNSSVSDDGGEDQVFSVQETLKGQGRRNSSEKERSSSVSSEPGEVKTRRIIYSDIDDFIQVDEQKDNKAEPSSASERMVAADAGKDQDDDDRSVGGYSDNNEDIQYESEGEVVLTLDDDLSNRESSTDDQTLEVMASRREKVKVNKSEPDDSKFERQASQDDATNQEPERTGISSDSLVNGHTDHQQEDSHRKVSALSDDDSFDMLADIEMRRESGHRQIKSSGDVDTVEVDFDFSVIKRTGHLNLNANKDRLSVAQRGSIAGRRKPSRNKHRSLNDDDLFRDSTEQVLRSDNVEMNGHDDAFEDDSDEDTAEENSTSPVTNPGKQMQGLRPAMVLPGLGDFSRTKLKSVKREPKPEATASQEKTEDSPSRPAWMANLKGRRVLPPTGTPEKQSSSEEAEKPAWMAMARKRKVMDPLKDKEKKEEETVAPWMKERLQRRSQASPLQPSKSTNDNTAQIPSSSSPPSNDSSADISDTHEPEPTVDKSSNFVHQLHPRKDLLSPLPKKPALDREEPMDQDENKPPLEETSDSLIKMSPELPPKASLPPLAKTPSLPSQGTSKTDEEEEEMPQWKKEIAQRRKSKTHVPLKRPEQPMTMTDVPLWKRELSVKQKQRKDTDGPKPMETTPTKDPAASPEENVSPWQRELAKRKMRPIPQKNSEPIEKQKSDEAVPDWMKQVQQRRQRLANTGLISSEKKNED